MKYRFQHWLGQLPDWLYSTPDSRRADQARAGGGAAHTALSQNSIDALLNDERIPADVRSELREEFEAIETMAEKLRAGEIHIAVFGRVSVGKSSVLNALVGEPIFSVSPLHGETREEHRHDWQDERLPGVMLIDTPGIDELDGEGREALAVEVTSRADLVLFVVEGDFTRVERDTLLALAERQRPILVLLNKCDRLSDDERQRLLARLRETTDSLPMVRGVHAIAADPRPEIVIELDDAGRETRRERPRNPDIDLLKAELWDILEREGRSLAALNAALFTREMDDRVARRVVELRAKLAERVVQTYSLAKGLVVAVNPVPVADLLAAAGTDVALVMHLGEIYGFKPTRREAGKLLLTISGQLVLLMGAYWGVNLVSSALKTMSAGMSTAITAVAQGALGYYATTVVGRAAQAYYLNGRSWGEGGAKTTIRTILDSLDRDSILLEAREAIQYRLRSNS